MGGRGNSGNRAAADTEKTFNVPVVSDSVATNINRVVDNIEYSNEQTVFIGERTRINDDLLDKTDQKAVVSAVKTELKNRGVAANVSITTSKMGPNVYAQYLHIRRKEN